jgi:hypothetical protein
VEVLGALELVSPATHSPVLARCHRLELDRHLAANPLGGKCWVNDQSSLGSVASCSGCSVWSARRGSRSTIRTPSGAQNLRVGAA